jgi:uncharacterized protein YjeT (DUF2065 family)
MAVMMEAADTNLRTAGIAAAVVGVLVVWLARG